MPPYPAKLLLLFNLFVFVHPALMINFVPAATAHNSNHFAEYIGAQYLNVTFSDVPVNPRVDFHFILAFAIDYTTATSPPSPTDGQFNIYWDTSNHSPASVAAVKQANPNVRVAVSLGGDSVSGYPAYFNITSVDSWVANAVSSLTAIIQQFHLDGIDIDYEHFQADPQTFAECIGRLVRTLKRNGTISFASIAPFDEEVVQTHYQELWRRYGDAIDYVNFQFYAYSSSTTAEQYVAYYEEEAMKNYPGGRVLASFTTGTSLDTVSPETALNASRRLQEERELFGIFIFEADDSLSQGFTYEKEAQAILANATTLCQ